MLLQVPPMLEGGEGRKKGGGAGQRRKRLGCCCLGFQWLAPRRLPLPPIAERKNYAARRRVR